MNTTMKTTDAFIKATQDQPLKDFSALVTIAQKYRDETTKAHKQTLWDEMQPKKRTLFSGEGRRQISYSLWCAGSGSILEATSKGVSIVDNIRQYCLLPFEGKYPLYWFSKPDNTVYVGECKYDSSKCANVKVIYEEIRFGNKEIKQEILDNCADIKDVNFYVHWKKADRPVPKDVSRIYLTKPVWRDGLYLQSFSEILNWVENPYYRNWINEYVNQQESELAITSLAFLVTRPELEIINKIDINGQKGPTCFYDLMTGGYCWGNLSSMFPQWNRIFKAGTKIKDICSLPTQLIHSLWNNPDLSQWDTARKMITLRGCTPDEIIRLSENRDRVRLNKIDEIIRAKYDDKPIFTIETLLNYINRLDVYQGVYEWEALDLIRDCLSMCRTLNRDPKDVFEKDSIKREHDLLMRSKRNYVDPKIIEGINKSCTDRFAYKNNQYFVRQIKSYEDLVDEGTRQHNCLVNAYSKRIAEGTSLIYVMRSLKNPESSLISIELDPSGQDIRQKYLAYNQYITNPDQLKFIKEWNQFRQKIIESEMEVKEV